MGTIKIDGNEVKTLNSYSCGPGEKAHTFALENSAYVYCVAGVWKLQRPGQYPAVVTVEA